MSSETNSILLIEANPQYLEELAALISDLVGSHIELATARTASSALNQIDRSTPDMVLSSDCLEDAPTGWLSQLVERVKPSPVVAFSRDAGYERVISALRQGASDFFSLPVEDPEDLNRVLKRQLKQVRLVTDSRYLREQLEQSQALLQDDQQAGWQVQQKMLPKPEAVINGYRFEYRLKPSLFLSGDFVDFFRISESLSMFYLADISGHGASSAFVTVLLKNMTNRLLRNYHRGSSFDILSPTDVLERINKELIDTGLGKHLTIFVGLLDQVENSLQYGVGGHFPMPILVQGGSAKFLGGSGMPVGLFEDPQFDGRVVELDENFSLTLFSDGILEILPHENLTAKENFLLDLAARGYDNMSGLMKASGVDQVQDAPDDIAALSVSRVR